MNEFLQAALRYAELGWHVFPLAPGQKTPITSHGVKDATTDKNQIKKWWAKWPNANIALACGKTSGVYVIDVDIFTTGDVNGRESLREFPSLPTTISQNTPRGGFHAFFKTENSPANRNSFRPGIDIRGDGYYVVIAPSVLRKIHPHPNGGKYTWVKGQSPWDILPAEYPDFMRPVIKAPWLNKELKDERNSIRDTPESGVQPSDEYGQKIKQTPKGATKKSQEEYGEIFTRPSAYLAQCEPAIQGQAGHDKLLYAASRMVHGFLLTDAQAYDILVREYNPRCVPPWDLSSQKDEKDFRRKISEARRLPSQNPEGWLLNDSLYSNCSSDAKSCIVDVDALLSGSEIQGNEQKIHNDNYMPQCIGGSNATVKINGSELEFLCRPTGLLGELCSWLNATSLRSQPFLSLAASLTFLGALFGRKIKDDLGSRTNLYCMGVAPSSAGKQHALNQIRNLCSSAGCVDLLGGDYIASDAAIEERISRSPTTLFLWDEIGHLLAHIRSGASRNHAQVVSLLMKLYSAAGSMYLGREYAEKERQRSIIQPCCCIYGTSTPERFTSGISPEELQDGWLSRCLVFNSSETPRKKRDIKQWDKIPDRIIQQVRAWYELKVVQEIGSELSRLVTENYDEAPPEQIVVPTTGDSERIFITFDDETTNYGKSHPQLARLWGKGEENARRIALVVAAGENFESPVITPQIADYACRLIRYLLIDFGEKIVPEIVSSETEKNKRKVYRVIDAAGKSGITMQYLTRATRWSNQRGRKDILDDLFAAGDVAIERDGKGIRYWSDGNYQKYLEKKDK